MRSAQQGLLAVHAAVFIFGLTALFSRLIALSALEITLLRSLFAVLALWGFIRWKGESIALAGGRDYLIALLLGEWPESSTVIGGLIVVAAAMFESYMAGRRERP